MLSRCTGTHLEWKRGIPEIDLRVAMECSIRSRWDTLEGPLRGDRQGDGHVTDREAYFLTRLTFHKL